MKKYLPLSSILVFALCFVIFDACHTQKRMTGSSGIPTLNPAANIVVNGQNVTLQYNTSSQSDGFSISFSNVGSATCSTVSIKTTSAYGFVPNNATFAPSLVNSSMPQYTCTQNGMNIVLSEAPPLINANFRPWVDDFTITVGQTVFTVTVDSTLTASQTLTRAAVNGQAEMNLNSNFSGCGLAGTILQRAYDCSKMITNYGATVTGNAATSGTNAACGAGDDTVSPTCTYYTPFTDPNAQNPDLFWFVVSCPNTNGSSTVPQQSCAWLTPVVTSDQPALDTGGTETFTLDTITAYQKRLLFSGNLTNGTIGYDFANANGLDANSPADPTTAQTYDDDSTKNPGGGADGAQPTPTPTTVCVAAAGDPLNATYTSGITFAASDAAIRDLISSSTGATISWQMPSYPMLNILTGGTPTGGSAFCNQTDGSGRSNCDEANAVSPNGSNVGFNAINIPGFADSQDGTINTWLWSSSSFGGGNA